MNIQILRVAVKIALIIASIGMGLRLMFFSSWLAVFQTFILLFSSWFLMITGMLYLFKQYFEELYHIILYEWAGIMDDADEASAKEPLSAQTDNPTHTETSLPGNLNTASGLSSQRKPYPYVMQTNSPTSAAEDDINPEEIFNSNNNTTQASKNLAKKGPPITPPPFSKKDSAELQKIKTFQPKEIAKAVKLMMGPEEDNPLIKKK